MPRVIILGSSNAIPSEDHENSHLALVGDDRLVLIDCVNNPIVRLRKAALDIADITDIVLTHFHPDHVSGVPLLLMNMWLLGRENGIRIYGLDYTLERLEKMMDLYGWKAWPDFFDVELHRIDDQELVQFQGNEQWRIYSSPVKHIIPNIGLRIEFLRSGKVFAYSGDTEPCEEVIRLAENADILVHEATGASWGHSDAAQAGEIATRAGAKDLYLIHYPNGMFKDEGLVIRAESTFAGKVGLAKDFLEFKL